MKKPVKKATSKKVASVLVETPKKKKINSRTKGQSAERRLAKLFSAWWGSEFFRTPGSGAFATKGFAGIDTSSMAGDLVTTDSTFPFCVESKKVEGWTLEQILTSNKTKIHSWWEQTVRECPPDKVPLLVFTKNHSPVYCMLSSTHNRFHWMTQPRWQALAGTVDSKARIHEEEQQLQSTIINIRTGPLTGNYIFALDLLLASDKKVWLLKDGLGVLK